MPKGIVNGSSAELLVSHSQVCLELRSVLTENRYSVQPFQCPATLSQHWTVFPADEQPHHINWPLDLKLISNFAVSRPPERSGWEVAAKTRILPGQAGGVPGAQTMGRGECGRAEGVRMPAFQNTCLWWAGGGLQYSRCWRSSTLCEYKNSSEVFPVRLESCQANSPEGDRCCEGWQTAQSRAASPAVRPAERPGRTRRVTPAEPDWEMRCSLTRAGVGFSSQGNSYRINFVAHCCQGGEEGGVRIWWSIVKVKMSFKV